MVSFSGNRSAPAMGPVVVDPELKALVPPLAAEEAAGLEQSILAEGCRDALVVWAGQNILLDGHHRLEICGRRGLPYRTVARDFPDRDAAKGWMIRNQLSRRNLTPFQRVELALALEPRIRGRAKANQGARTDISQNSVESVDTQKELGRVAGVSHDTVAKAKLIVEQAPEEVRIRLRRGEASIHSEYQRIVCGATAARIVASTENEWYTPAGYVEAAREVLGGIDLDPASSPQANQTVKATRFYTTEDDGLHQPWSGRVWLNPPYGGLAGEFANRLVSEYGAGMVEAGILLANSNCTDTDWFQPLWEYRLCFTNHRIDFESPGREKKTGSTHGSVFVYLGPDNEAFQKRFSEFGAVVGKIPPVDRSSDRMSLAA